MAVFAATKSQCTGSDGVANESDRIAAMYLTGSDGVAAMQLAMKVTESLRCISLEATKSL